MATDLHDYVLSLVTVLCRCPKMGDPEGRQQIIDELPENIRSGIRSFSDSRSHVHAMVSRCTLVDGGIETLLERLEAFDGGTRVWPDVKRAADVLLAKMQPSAREAPGVEPSTEGQRSLALVIGISRYRHGVDAGRDKGPEQFTNLASAADDARAVYELLKGRSGYDVAEPLVDDAATLSGILQGLDTLRRRCRHGYQTALIYFSGHGAVDDDDRSFLVPHDARSNNLFATALWSRTLNSALEEFKNCRLVLLIDACNSGGVNVGGAKSARSVGFDPALLAPAGSSDRFVIASSMPRQISYEAAGHGIFTRHLIDLLNPNDPSVSTKEEIDLFDLYAALKTRVKQKTAELIDWAVQEPFASFDGRTGVILAINEALRRQRSERQRPYLRALLKFVPDTVPCNSPLTFRRRLTDYVEARIKRKGFDSLYQCFEELAVATDPDDSDAVISDTRDLIKFFEEATTDVRSSCQPSNWSPAQDRPAAGPRPDPVPAQGKPAASPSLEMPMDATANALLLGGPPPPPLAPATAPEGRRGSAESNAGTREDRRVLEESDVTYILQDMLSSPTLYREAGKLREVLTAPDGVRSMDVTTWLLDTKPKTRPDGWEAMTDGIAERFTERFANAKKVEHASTISLRAMRRV